MNLLGEQEEEREAPELFSTRTVVLAVALHLVLFAGFWLFALCHFKPREVAIPIDLTVVVQENLDGNEDEPPPLKPPTPEPEPPKVTPKPPEPEPPKIEDPRLDAVVKTPEKKPEKKVEKKPEPPKKSKEELLKEKLERMKKSARKVKASKTTVIERNNGRTAKKTLSDAEIQKLLNQGYRPGRSEQLASSEEQRCLSLIQMAIRRKWDQLRPQIGTEGTVLLSVNFDGAGRLVNCRVYQSCGDRVSDAAALMVAKNVGAITGLSSDFINRFRGEALVIRYKVTGQ